MFELLQTEGMHGEWSEEYSTTSNSESESSRDDGTNDDNFDEQQSTMEEVNLIPSDSELPNMEEAPSTPVTIKMEDIGDTQTKLKHN